MGLLWDRVRLPAGDLPRTARLSGLRPFDELADLAILFARVRGSRAPGRLPFDFVRVRGSRTPGRLVGRLPPVARRFFAFLMRFLIAGLLSPIAADPPDAVPSPR